MQLEHRQYIKFIKSNLKRPNGRATRKNLIITPSLLKLVKNQLPKQPWKKHIHKDVAIELAISNKLAHKAISTLVKNDDL
jgi:hypothetical protein